MIISCGEALIDFIPPSGADLRYVPCTGGSPYNLAIAVARLGTHAGFLGKISRDFFGDMLYDRLVAEGVDTTYTRRSHRLSTLAFVLIEEGRDPRYTFYAENSADRNLSAVDIPETLPEEVACVEFGSISLLLEPQATTIKSLVRREFGKRVLSFDPNVRPSMVANKKDYLHELESLLGYSTIVKVSTADLQWLYPGQPPLESATEWLAKGAGLVVVTRGKDGALLVSPHYSVETPEFPVEVVDTVGAGDTFHAALLVRLREIGRLTVRAADELTREEAQDVLDFAVKASSLNCARKGANPPTSAEMAAT